MEKKKSSHIYALLLPTSPRIFFSFFFVKLHFYLQTFRKLQNSLKMFYVFQKHPQLEGSRCLSNVQTHPLKITSLSLKFLIFSLFPQNFDFFFNLVLWPLLTSKIIIKSKFLISQNIFHTFLSPLNSIYKPISIWFIFLSWISFEIQVSKFYSHLNSTNIFTNKY